MACSLGLGGALSCALRMGDVAGGTGSGAGVGTGAGLTGAGGGGGVGVLVCLRAATLAGAEANRGTALARTLIPS